MIREVNAVWTSEMPGASCILCRKESDSCRCPQCEVCDEKLDARVHDIIDGRFCSLDCHQEAEDDVRIGRLESSQQYEMFGADFDSWFR